MAFLLFQTQTVGFGSPGYGDVMSAVKVINENTPSFFYEPLKGEAGKEFIAKAMLVAKNWEASGADPKSRERMEHVMMQLKVSGSNGAEKYETLKRMMLESYGVRLGSDALTSAIGNALKNNEPQTLKR